jgi:nitroreductase
MENMDALTALTTRSTAVRLVEPAPAGANLAAILAAGARAPDHGRLRPWKFVLVRGAARDKLGQLLVSALRARQPDAPEAVFAKERDRAQRAPLIVAVAAKVRAHPKIPAIEQIISAGAAAQNMLVAAHALGFGGMWKTGPAAYDGQVKAGLGLEPEDVIVGFLYFGTHAAPPPTKAADIAGLCVEWNG